MNEYTYVTLTMKIQTDFYTLTLYSDVLLVEAFASWDETVVEDLFTRLKEVTRTYYHDKEWGLITDATRWLLNTPEAAQSIPKTDNHEIRHTLRHHAWVAGDSEIKKWQISQMMMTDKQFESRVFQSVDDAWEWLKSLGYQIIPV
ncbi:MAG: hypothetical protein D3926_25545 [Desulfobacteraceae bacterium]|nr:MAG: hypothetical protein D3926_25545 [Desulfobacteraceae bacterium]